MTMYMAFARYKNQPNMELVAVTLGHQPMPFYGELGIMELMTEKMRERYTEIEYHLKEVKTQ